MRNFLLHMACMAALSCIACRHSANRNHSSAILFERMDTSVSPAVDFFQYANGGWIARNPIPDEQSAWGIANLVIEENLTRLRSICEKAGSTAAVGTPERLVGDFYRMAMDSLRTERDGLSGLQPLLDRIASITDVNQLARVSAEMRMVGSYTFFVDYIAPDAKNSERMAYQLWQGGQGLPERDYYLKDDTASRSIRKAYERHLAHMLSMAGEDSIPAEASARDVLALETRMARAGRRLEDLRDPYANYHKFALADLGGLSSRFEWASHLEVTGTRAVDSVIVGQPEYIRAIDTLLATTPLTTWKSYLRYHLLQAIAYALPERISKAAFEFERNFSGAKVRKPRWKRAIRSTEDAMGELLGRQYVKTYFDARAKARYANLVEHIRDALAERIRSLPWMGDSTRQRALTKLAAMNKKVGYPDRWKDFSGMRIDTVSWVRNALAANRWWHAYQVAKLGKPVDRSEWDMYPQTYNAYYNASNNEIVLPAGIFTIPGLRDEEIDDATVYGYAGASTIGHEIIHGFDDEGRKFDDKGNLSNWWTPADEKAFQQGADRIIRQFNAFEALPGLFVNGRATTGENIADLGGVVLGLHAYRKTEEFRKNEKIHGFSPTQRYFLGYALGWLDHAREEYLRNLVLTDFHAPPKYRVNGPFANLPEFHEAFGVRPGQPMYRPDSTRVRIW